MIDPVALESIYEEYGQREYVCPDPLQFLYDYPGVGDREIVALIASSLAYGRVAQILRSVEHVLSVLGASPRAFIEGESVSSLAKAFAGFKHRFATGRNIASLLLNAKKLILGHGSLNACFCAGMDGTDETVRGAMTGFAAQLGRDCGHLIPSPDKGSACKRMNLFLRWMVREDAVDPGGWTGVSPAQLIVPLDVHMARIGQMLRLTGRKSANMAMALDITAAFRSVAPDDPVKYDFALTRFGIRDGLEINDIPRRLRGTGTGRHTGKE